MNLSPETPNSLSLIWPVNGAWLIAPMLPRFALAPSMNERFSTVSLFCMKGGNTFQSPFSSSGQYHSSDITPSVFILSSVYGLINGLINRSNPLSSTTWSLTSTPYATFFAIPTICDVATGKPRI